MPESPAGWYPDPFGRHERRHWNGAKWTEHVASSGHQSIDPPVDSTPVLPVVAPQAPDGWHLDPFGRYERRYWDGSAWTEHVVSRGAQGVDAPVPHKLLPAAELAVEPAVGRPKRKIARQARKAGAGDGQGGGTLSTEQVLVVNQKAKLVGSTLRYAIYNRRGQQLGTVSEVRRGMSAKLSDGIRGRGDFNRTYQFQVTDINGRVLLTMTRPELGLFGLKSPLLIQGPGGIPIGQIARDSKMRSAASTAARGVSEISVGTSLKDVSRRLKSAVHELDILGGARFSLEAGGHRLGSIHSANYREWNFTILDAAGTEIASITKTWAGWAKERFTKTDNYVVIMHQSLEDPLRSLVIAAAVGLDFELKQHGEQTRGSSLLGTRSYE